MFDHISAASNRKDEATELYIDDTTIPVNNAPTEAPIEPTKFFNYCEEGEDDKIITEEEEESTDPTGDSNEENCNYDEDICLEGDVCLDGECSRNKKDITFRIRQII